MDVVAAAQELLDALENDPGAVIDRGRLVVAEAEAQGLVEAEATAIRAMALAHLRRGDPVMSLRLLDHALTRAEGLGVEGEVHMSRVGPLTELGRLTEARQAAALAVAQLKGVARARALLQNAVLEFRVDGRPEVIESLEGIEQELADAGDTVWLIRLWINRVHMRAFVGDYGGADRDIAQVIERHRQANATGALRGALVLRSEFAAHRGDLVGALRFLDEIDSGDSQVQEGLLELHRSDVYRRANLVDEALAAARAAIVWFTEQGLELARAESALSLADALRGEGQLEEAAEWARAAEAAFSALQRKGWLDHARLLVQELAGGAQIDLLELAASMFDRGLGTQAVSSALRILEDSLEAGEVPDTGAVKLWLKRARAVGGPDLAIQARHIRALVALFEGDVAAAKGWLRAGMKLFEDLQAGLGATEIRVLAARRAMRVGATALRTVIESGRPMEILRWMERTRAGSLRLPPVTPPSDPEMAEDLARLRALEQRRSADPASTRKEQELRQRIRRRARLLEGDRVASVSHLTVDALVSRLEDGVLIAFDEVDGRVIAVGVSASRRRIWDGGPAEELTRLSDGMRFALQRLASTGTSAASRETAWDGLVADAAELQSRLLAPMGRAERLVISPPARFHSMPFGAIDFRGPMTVTPAIESWLRPDADSGRGVVLVAGPDLAHSSEEVEKLALLHDRPAVFSGESATVGEVMRKLDGASIAHFASHGTFRSDNPLFSALLLADGGLNVYEMQRLQQSPRTVVLSACDTGLSAAHPGNELMGMVAGLLGAGTKTVVAPVGVFPDSAGTVEIMVEIHRRLARGTPPAEALADLAAVSDLDLAVSRMSLLCFGS